MTTQVPGYVSKTDMVAALIRELLITGELGPGEQLRQRDLASGSASARPRSARPCGGWNPKAC